MSDLNLFVPLAKVDLDRRLVHGVVTAEVADRSGEICDYASTKPYYEAWSAEATQASGGKSLGALRAMHGRVAAGKLTDISFDEDGKRILVAAKIVDDDEWRKVAEGVYTGFSQGGRYVARWPDPDSGLTRYTAEPREISLVDQPCLPSATFEVVKGGVTERRAFAAKALDEPPSERADASQRLAELATLLQEVRALNARLDKDASAVVADDAPTAPSKILESDAADAAAAKAAAPPPAVADEPASSELAKAFGEVAALRSQMQDLAPSLAALAARVAALEAQPLPAKAALRALSKSADGFRVEAGSSVDEAIRRLAALPPTERALALTKLSLATPISPRL